MKKVVIIGGVAGGASCAARLRRLDAEAEIVMLERGEYISYANCGLPYHVGGVIKSRSALLLQTPEAMRKKFNIDVRIKNEALSIDREKKFVRVRDIESGSEYDESYDTLVIATGSSPLRPRIPGIESERVRTLWTVPDTDRLIESLNGARRTAVIGGGFIGLEIAENLRHAGLEVALIEALDQVMAPLDPEMAASVHNELRENGVELHLSDAVAAFEDDGASVTVRLASGESVKADLAVLSIGVRPNSGIASECGLELGKKGGIVTDEFMRTSDRNIYAVGDVAEVRETVFGEKAMIALAGPANKQGRIAADNISGRNEAYKGTQGTSVVKIFGLTCAFTGANEKTLIARGMARGRDYEKVLVIQNHHAGYYPGAKPMTIKLLFAADGSKIFGAQITGFEGVDKRIDTIAVAQRLGAPVTALKELELAYAPPFSSAKDPVNMAGFVAENVLTGLVKQAEWDAPEKEKEAVLLDVREPAEVTAYSIPNAVNIPLGQLRARLGELDKSRRHIVFCAIGVRAYNGARILSQAGFEDVAIYPGGARFYSATHPDDPKEGAVPEKTIPKAETRSEKAMESVKLDCCGLQCPGPIMEVYKKMNELKEGELLEVSASDPGFNRDIVSWCRRMGNTLVSREEKDGAYIAVIRKGAEGAANPAVKEGPRGKTIIVFDGDLDKVLASFIIANGALAMGRPVTMFFTFWGLNALRRDNKVKVNKTFIEKMFGFMLPRGSKKLKLSKMNMGGMGTAMMKGIMKDKNIDSLEELIKKAIDAGVKLIACSMSMDVMGIKPEELIDGVEIGGVGTYLGDAEESDVNLFI